MENKLWCFGDSYTQRYTTGSEWSKNYIDFKGYTPKVYCDFLSEELGIESENCGVGGFDNYSIFESLCKKVHLINENDIIIIGWSSIIRFRLASKDGSWVKFVPGAVTDYHLSHHTDVSRTTIEEIFINRDSLIYYNEVNTWIHFINHTLNKNRIIHWTPFDDNISLNAHKLLKFETIKMETNVVEDHHYGENAHKKLSSIFFEMLKNKLI